MVNCRIKLFSMVVPILCDIQYETYNICVTDTYQVLIKNFNTHTISIFCIFLIYIRYIN
jgi:hypothetical protein